MRKVLIIALGVLSSAVGAARADYVEYYSCGNSHTLVAWWLVIGRKWIKQSDGTLSDWVLTGHNYRQYGGFLDQPYPRVLPKRWFRLTRSGDIIAFKGKPCTEISDSGEFERHEHPPWDMPGDPKFPLGKGQDFTGQPWGAGLDPKPVKPIYIKP